MEEDTKMKIYLAHGKHHRLDGKWIEYQLKSWGHEVCNPFDGTKQAERLTKQWENEVEIKNRYSLLSRKERKMIKNLSNEIHEKDMKGIGNAQVIVVYYPDASTGTAKEIVISKIEYEKQVIVMTDLIHPFIVVYADYIIPPFPEGLNQLRKILKQIEVMEK